MSENILDDFQGNQDTLKYSQVFIFIWLLYAVASIYFGLSFIYQYSNSGLLWFMTIPITSAYALIITGIFALLINEKIRNNDKKIGAYLLIFLGITFFFYLGDCLQIGVGRNMTLKRYLLELLNLNYIINVILVLITYRSLSEKKSLKGTIKTAKKYFFLIFLGLLPVLLAQLMNYDFFSFLHI